MTVGIGILGINKTGKGLNGFADELVITLVSLLISAKSGGYNDHDDQ